MKMDGWNTILSFCDDLFSGANLLLVSGRVILEFQDKIPPKIFGAAPGGPFMLLVEGIFRPFISKTPRKEDMFPPFVGSVA